MKNGTTLVLAALACGIAASVQAQSTLTWDWTYGGIYGNLASGTFTTQATTSSNPDGATGYLITGITGTWDGYATGNSTITSILALGNGTYGNDNLILTGNSTLWQLSDYGIAFNLANGRTAGIVAGDLGTGPTYVGSTENCYITEDGLGSSLGGETYASNFSITAVPEPSTLALAGLGVAGLLFLRRARPATRATVVRIRR